LTLFEREGCHLCEDLLSSLSELIDPMQFELTRVDIDSDPVLKKRYNEFVPVLMDGDQEICHHFLDLIEVKKVLARYNRDSRGPSDGQHR